MATKKVTKKYCIRCDSGKGRKLKPLTDFYVSETSEDGRVNLCKKCYNEMSTNEDGTINIEGFKEALRIMDKPFDEEVLKSAIENSKTTKSSSRRNPIFGYISMINSLPQNNGKDYTNSIVAGTETKIKTDKKKLNEKLNKDENEKVKWDKRDLQNKKYVIETFGYDPFADSVMTEKDRKHSYNILSGYCDTDGIREDGHKMQAVLRLTANAVQGMRIDDLINEENAKDHPDIKKIKDMTSTNKSLMDSNAKIAAENNISAKSNKNAKQGANSLTSKMKEIEEAGIYDIKVNMIDVKTCEAYKKLDKMSMDNIMSQILMGENEWSALLKESSEFNSDLQKKNDELFEENRLLKNRIVKLENLLDEAKIEYEVTE